MLVFNALATGFNWLTLTASVSSVPLATLVILLPPLFRPDLVRDTWLGEPSTPIFRPSVVSTLSPAVTLGVTNPAFVSVLSPAFKVVAVTLFNVTSSAVATVMFLPSRVTLMFLPSLKLTVSPAATFSSAPSFACSFQPFSAVSFTDLIASWTLALPVSPMLAVDTLPFSFLASPPKIVFRFTWVASN